MTYFNPPHWMRRGFCRGANPDIFQDEGDAETALGYCDRCMVRAECLEWALNHDETGVWGGTTESERRAVKRGGKRATCPGCGASQMFDEGRTTICILCGISWWNT